jgi:hypothetical protein
MDLPVTFPTEGDEILFRIMAELTAWRDVVDFEPHMRTARLTAPTIAFQH